MSEAWIVLSGIVLIVGSVIWALIHADNKDIESFDEWFNSPERHWNQYSNDDW